MKTCGPKFQEEIGKFRFLNEMIKLVSPKYLGNRTTGHVKQRVVELLYVWSKTFANYQKIGEAYQMLKRQGIVQQDPTYLDHETPQSAPSPRCRNPVFEDDEKAKLLQKLLQSKNPEDLQAANRLIKSMVKEDERRMERVARRVVEIETVTNNAKLLDDMLDHYQNQHSSSDEVELMKELHHTCEQLRPKLFKLAGEMDEKDDGLEEILKANDELSRVIVKFKKAFEGQVNGEPGKKSETATPGNISLLDLSSPTGEVHPEQNFSLVDDQLLALGLDDTPQGTPKRVVLKENQSGTPVKQLATMLVQDKNLTLDELSEIFSSVSSPAHSVMAASKPPLIRTTVPNSATDFTKTVPVPIGADGDKLTRVPKGLEELDLLGQTLLRQSLPSSCQAATDFTKLTDNKVSLNELAIRSISAAKEEEPSLESLLVDLNVPFESILPGSLPPVTLWQESDISVSLHLARNLAHPDVRVIVLTTINSSSESINDFVLTVSVAKPAAFKLQSPSGSILPAYNAFLPPAAITQVVLIASSSESIKLCYKISYLIKNETKIREGEQTVNLSS